MTSTEFEKFFAENVEELIHQGAKFQGYETVDVKKMQKSKAVFAVRGRTITPTGQQFVWKLDQTFPHLQTPPSLQRAWK